MKTVNVNEEVVLHSELQESKIDLKVLCIDGIKISTHVNFYKVHYIVIKSMWVYENLLTIIKHILFVHDLSKC